jgi:hypothetical protein
MSERIFLTYTNATAVPFGPVRRLSVVVALLVGLTLISNARADSASCLAKVTSYVTELDELLSKEKSWLTPYDDLNGRYFPFRDCEVDALLDTVRRSRFIRSISYSSRANLYFIRFSSDEVRVSFTYVVSEKKSDPDTNTAMWVHK